MLCFLLFIVSIHALTFSQLRVEHLIDPLGVTQTNPRFSWTLLDSASTRGQAQTAYEIIVSSSPDCQNGDMWDSGKVSASKSYLNLYQGKPLNASTRYYWKVRVWDVSGTASSYSSIATFVTGTSSWNGATWITGGDANNQLRTEFNVPGGSIQKSILHVSGLGYYELYCNGEKVGDHMLEVGWTDYAKRVYYVTWDISEYIRPGTANAIGVVLGNSWFACAGGQPGCQKIPPQLLLTATIQTSGGSIQVNSNLASWKVSPGPITYNSLYNGEMYDARLETPGWTSPGFNQNGWKNPIAGSANPPLISPQLFEPIRKLQSFSGGPQHPGQSLFFYSNIGFTKK
jgi:alpha-L-rhamnosidase